MIVPDYPYKDKDGVVHYDKIKFYSDKNFQIKQKETEKIFDNVIDNYPSPYSYIETDMLVEVLDIDTLKEKSQAYDIIMGVSE